MLSNLLYQFKRIDFTFVFCKRCDGKPVFTLFFGRTYFHEFERIPFPFAIKRAECVGESDSCNAENLFVSFRSRFELNKHLAVGTRQIAFLGTSLVDMPALHAAHHKKFPQQLGAQNIMKIHICVNMES